VGGQQGGGKNGRPEGSVSPIERRNMDKIAKTKEEPATRGAVAPSDPGGWMSGEERAALLERVRDLERVVMDNGLRSDGNPSRVAFDAAVGMGVSLPVPAAALSEEPALRPAPSPAGGGEAAEDGGRKERAEREANMSLPEVTYRKILTKFAEHFNP